MNDLYFGVILIVVKFCSTDIKNVKPEIFIFVLRYVCEELYHMHNKY